LKIPKSARINIEIENLLKKMLEPNIDLRISFSELFSHPFFSLEKNLSINSTTHKSPSQHTLTTMKNY